MSFIKSQFKARYKVQTFCSIHYH